jgi:hypothetical protein
MLHTIFWPIKPLAGLTDRLPMRCNGPFLQRFYDGGMMAY